MNFLVQLENKLQKFLNKNIYIEPSVEVGEKSKVGLSLVQHEEARHQLRKNILIQDENIELRTPAP